MVGGVGCYCGGWGGVGCAKQCMAGIPHSLCVCVLVGYCEVCK